MNSGNDGKCKVCGRFIGPVTVCPYCSEDVPQSPLLRSLRIAAVILATLGLFLLYLGARIRQPPAVNIAQISPAMNFAHVRITGRVKRKPYIGKERDYISFLLSGPDGHTIKIFARGRTAKKMISDNCLPATGTAVSVRGELHVSANNKALELKLPAHLETIPDTQKQTNKN